MLRQIVELFLLLLLLLLLLLPAVVAVVAVVAVDAVDAVVVVVAVDAVVVVVVVVVVKSFVFQSQSAFITETLGSFRNTCHSFSRLAHAACKVFSIFVQVDRSRVLS